MSAHHRACPQHASAPLLDRPDSTGRPTAHAAAAPYAVEPADTEARAERIRRLQRLLDERIVVLDGAMGTMIQRHALDEAGYRGARFRDYGRDLRGNNDLLVLTRDLLGWEPTGPSLIEDLDQDHYYRRA